MVKHINAGTVTEKIRRNLQNRYKQEEADIIYVAMSLSMRAYKPQRAPRIANSIILQMDRVRPVLQYSFAPKGIYRLSRVVGDWFFGSGFGFQP